MFCRNNLTGHHNTSGNTRYHIISYCVVSYEQKYTFKSIFSRRFSDPLEMRLKEYDKATYTLHSTFLLHSHVMMKGPDTSKDGLLRCYSILGNQFLIVDHHKSKSLNIEEGKVEVRSLKTALYLNEANACFIVKVFPSENAVTSIYGPSFHPQGIRGKQ